MLVHSTQRRTPALATEALAEPRVAVLLNANAKRVNGKVISRVGHVVPEDDIFVSRRLEDVPAIARKVVDRRYTTIFTGGGDGTFVSFVNAVQAELAERGIQRLPRFGVLKLGTGNSLANLVGASPLSGDGILDDILRARASEVPSVRRLDLLTCGGKMAPFAGLGYDAALLNDFNHVKNSVPVAKGLMASEVGYLAALATKTLPHYLVHRKPVQAEVVCTGRAMKVDAEGRATHVFQPGDVLYRGGLNIAAAGTVPCFGFNFKMFPFAGKRRGTFQLRLSALSGLACVANLPSLWKGTWRDPGIHDFLCDGAVVRFEREMPLQVGGDAAGYAREVTLGMAEKPIDLVDFTPSLN